MSLERQDLDAMNRLLGLLGISVLAPFAAAREPTLVTVWGATLGDSKGFEAVVREFERRNPDLKLRVLGMGAGKMNSQKLMTAIVGNAAPDVVKQDRFTIGDWASRSAFLDLNPLIERDSKSDPLCPRREQYYEAPWLEATYRGGLYAIPESADNRILYYNKAIFRSKAAELRKAGLDPDRPPRTWPELLAYSKVLTEYNRDGSIRRAGFLPLTGNAWLYMYAFMNDAHFMSNDGRTCTLYSPESEGALEFMIACFNAVGGYEKARAFESGFQGKENEPFIVGKVAMKIDGDWIIAQLARYGPSVDFGTAPPPVPEERYLRRGRFANVSQFITWGGGFSWAIPKGAKNPEAGWRFIKFATSVEGHLIEARADRAWEQRRGRQYVAKVMANREYNEIAFDEIAPKEGRYRDALRTHIDMSAFCVTRPATFVGQVLWDEHVRATERALLGSMTPRAALMRGQQVVQRELDEVLEGEKYPVVDSNIPIYLAGALILILVLVIGRAIKKAGLGTLGAHEAKWGYLMISPWLVGFLGLVVGPMVASLYYSLTRYNVLSPARFVGLENYAMIVGDDWANTSKAFMNAFYLAGVGVPLGIVTGLSIALLLDTGVRGMRVYRTLFYMPAIVPTIASAILWAWILAADPNKGLINAAWRSTIFDWFGVNPPTWLSSEHWSKPGLILQGLWGAGGGMLLWLAGLKGIPTTLHEAAEIDGATGYRRFWMITLPLLSPIVFFNVVTGFIGAIQEFDRVYIMKPAEGSAGPNDSLLSPVYMLFQNGFAYFKMGYASAIAWTLFAVILGLTLIQFRFKKRWVHEEVEG